MSSVLGRVLLRIEACGPLEPQGGTGHGSAHTGFSMYANSHYVQQPTCCMLSHKTTIMAQVDLKFMFGNIYSGNLINGVVLQR